MKMARIATFLEKVRRFRYKICMHVCVCRSALKLREDTGRKSTFSL